MDAVYTALGNRTDLCPYTNPQDTSTFDISRTQSVKLIEWINRGYKSILSWKFSNGRIIRFRSKEDSVNFRSVVKTGTLNSTYTDGNIPASYGTVLEDFVYIDSSFAAYDNYLDYIFEVTGGTGVGQKRRVVYATNGWIVFNKVLTTALDSTSEYKLTKNYYRVVPSISTSVSSNINYQAVSSGITFVNALRIYDMKDNVVIEKLGRTDEIIENNVETGIPTSFMFYRDKVLFDVAPRETRWYRLDFIKNPTELSNATDIPEIPEVFHEAIVLWAMWWGLRLGQESAEAYAVKRDLYDRMNQAVSEIDLEHEFNDYHGEVIDEYYYNS